MGWLKEAVEYVNWGWNALTISAMATFFFSVLQGWGMLKQSQMIGKKTKGESVSVVLYSYWFFYFVSFSIYGANQRSLAMLANSFLWVPCLLVLCRLMKFKKIKKIEELTFLFFCFMPMAMNLYPDKDRLFMVYLFGILIFMSFQPFEIWQKKDGGAVSPQLLATFFATGVFWFIYACYIGNWPLIIFNPLACLLIYVTFVLWRKYKPQTAIN
jgi:uncharacterized protein with PQ loop repeat